ncbi:MAG: DMT family transporter [Thermoplasmata archaeon]|nr:DMT family transporter [Thermoplasmata archaeon]MCI4356785.1 DMT family transporter [Thermoplasmata archaeon]
MEPDLRRRLFAASLALAAAFLWAAYYSFVLALAPYVAPSGLIVWPFVFGGIAYLTWTFVATHGRHLVRLSRSATAWARVLLLVLMQLSVLAETFLAGPVDTSLLSLIGDVVLTPILVMTVLREGREQARDPLFVGGVVLASVGAGLTIVAGGAVRPLTAAAALVAALVPFVVAIYFLSAAQENRRTPTAAVVAHATVFAALGSVLLSPLLPGGFGGLAIDSGRSLVLLVVLGTTSFFIAPAMYFRAIEEAGLVLPAVLMASIPVFTLLLSVALFGQIPPWLGIVGVPLAVLGAIVALQGSHPPWTRQYAAATNPEE